MDKILIAVGYSKNKLQKAGVRFVKKTYDYIMSSIDRYTAIYNIVRKSNQFGNIAKNDSLELCDDFVYDIPFTKVIEVNGYDLNISQWSKQFEYDIIGISTAASVLSIALSLYSEDMKVNILSEYCYDRMGLEKEAKKICDAYMPGVYQ